MLLLTNSFKKIDKTGVKVVKLSAKSRESMDSLVDYLTLHCKVLRDKSTSNVSVNFSKYRKLKELQGELNNEDEKRYKILKEALQKEILFAADIICGTCSSASDSRIKKFKFRQVLIDEATQACEPEGLISIVNGAKQLVLVGDHFQLGPVVMDKEAARAGLNQSLFERLIFAGAKPFRLTIQYRMHPFLTEFPSTSFYEGRLKNGITVHARTTSRVEFPWPQSDKPTVFHINFGVEEISASGTSYLNRAEAANVEKVVTLLLLNSVLPSQIGVITPYDGQKAHISLVLKEIGLLNQHYYQAV